MENICAVCSEPVRRSGNRWVHKGRQRSHAVQRLKVWAMDEVESTPPAPAEWNQLGLFGGKAA